MEFLDIMEEVSARSVTKSMTGDNRIYGVVVGIVEKNWDQKSPQPGKICVKIPNRDNESNILKWAKIAFPSMGDKWGAFFLPEVGDEVLVTFEEGNIDKPYVIGCIAKGNAKLVGECKNDKNAIKEIKARNGKSFIRYKDDGQEEPQEDNLHLELFEGKILIDLDSKEETVLISDKEKKNYISIAGKDDAGLIRILSQKKVEVKVADNVTMTLDTQQGKVSVKCDNFNVEANEKVHIKGSGGVLLESDKDIKFKTGKAIIDASDSVLVQASGSAKFTGSTVNVG